MKLLTWECWHAAIWETPDKQPEELRDSHLMNINKESGGYDKDDVPEEMTLAKIHIKGSFGDISQSLKDKGYFVLESNSNFWQFSKA